MYLAHIFALMRGTSDIVRQLAGIHLKNTVKKNCQHMSEYAFSYVKNSLLGALSDSERFIR